RDAVWSVDKDQAIGSVMTMEERLSSTLSRHRFGATLFTTFGIAAATLAAVGLYGVLAFIVSQRRVEIGVRMALGATRWNALSNVMGQGARLASVGIVGGLAMAAAANHLLSSLLYGTSPTDATTFAAVAGLLVVVSTAASVIPAIRATRVDPLIAIRTD